ncbi:MAG: metallophosphoesterase [Deltaproteobacteria bacterium]|nr:metallophosphoesterase [Deltaproteobacteria bacterium]
MKLQILADLHMEFSMSGSLGKAQKVLDDIYNTQADVTVIAGDLYTKGRSISKLTDLFPPDRQIIYVAGNHDYYGGVYQHALEKMWKEAAELPNIYFLENNAVEIGDVVFLGTTLWTDMRLFRRGPFAGLYDYPETLIDVGAGMNDYRKIRFASGGGFRPLRPADTVQIHAEAVRWLREQLEAFRGRKIVVVTHHAPSLRSVHESYWQDVNSAAYASHLDDLVEASGATLWVHGHMHEVWDYKIGETRIVCNCYGYSFELADAQGFLADLVIDV